MEKRRLLMWDNPYVQKARDFAIKAHGEQRYGEHPFIYHLDKVNEILSNQSPCIQVIGYLHDVLEDTDITIDILINEFGVYIANCVYFLSDVKGESRKIRKQKTYAKLKTLCIKNQEWAYKEALIVKMADRLANMRACIKDGNQGLLKMYQQEMADFIDVVYRPGLCDSLWIELFKLYVTLDDIYKNRMIEKNTFFAELYGKEKKGKE